MKSIKFGTMFTFLYSSEVTEDDVIDVFGEEYTEDNFEELAEKIHSWRCEEYLMNGVGTVCDCMETDILEVNE